MQTLSLCVIAGIIAAACSSPQNGSQEERSGAQSLDSTSPAASPIPDSIPAGDRSIRWNEQRIRGVDFLAMGNEPFWGVEIDFESMMRFKSLNQVDSLDTPVPEAKQSGPTTRYDATTEGGEISVTIAEEGCVDTMSGEEFPYTVRVRVRAGEMESFEEFSGCGLFLGDHRLNSTWVLESLNGNSIENTQLANDHPYLEIQMDDRRVSGFAGCNQINTNLVFGRSSLRFGPLISTRMSCPAMDFEQQLTQALSEQVFDYSLSGDQLTLSNSDNTLLFTSTK